MSLASVGSFSENFYHKTTLELSAERKISDFKAKMAVLSSLGNVEAEVKECKNK